MNRVAVHNRVAASRVEIIRLVVGRAGLELNTPHHLGIADGGSAVQLILSIGIVGVIYVFALRVCLSNPL